MKIYKKLKTIAIKLFMFIKFHNYYKNNIYIHPNSELIGKVIIGHGTNINGKAFISSGNSYVAIGRHCAIAHGLRIRNRNHNTNYANIQDKFQNKNNFTDLTVNKGSIYIGNSCWIGDNVTILPGVKIGNGVVIGACSVVTKSLPDYSICVGNPAKVINYRFNNEIIDFLINTKWWKWNDKKIIDNALFFNTDLNQYKGSIKELIKS